MALTDLPYTVFAEIASHLSPREVVAARRVSRTVHAALTRAELCISLLLRHFPRARESRELRTMLQRGDAALLDAVGWADALAATARRYHQLGAATPRSVDTIRIARDDDDNSSHLLRGVTPWHRFLRLDDKTATFHHWDPAWACDATADLLVYPVQGRYYVLRDVDSGRTWPVPFSTANRLVRRVRLAHKVLVFEWCEKQPVAGDDGAHRHFATAYDVTRAGRLDGLGLGRREHDLYTLRRYGKDSHGDKAEADKCTITFRCQWKIHGLGIPLRHQDRFFSAHNSTHYAVYIWQPSRSPWGEDEPLESLIIWDIGASSAPSASKPSSDGSKPRVIAQVDAVQLDYWGVRQRGAPRLRCLALDDCTRDPTASAACGHVFIIEEEHRWSAGPHSSPTPPRLHHVKATGIPLSGSGPCWVDECGGGAQSDAGGMPFCRRHTDGAETWAGRCPCWRHDDFPYLTVCEVRDVPAGVRFSARHCFMLETLSVHVKPRLRVHGVPPPAPHALGRLSPSTKTSSSHGDRNAKRMTARGGAAEYKSGRGPAGEAVVPGCDNLGAESESDFDGPDAIAREVQFGDDAWPMLLNVGYICGDERWLIGEATDGSITIMHF